MNLDYGYCPIEPFVQRGKHRATADPVIAVYDGKYFLFSTNQWGYWWSDDMVAWRFVARKFLLPEHTVWDELCAPAVWVLHDKLMVIGSTHTQTFPIWQSSDPTTDDWQVAKFNFSVGAWDPAFFVDDDGRFYLYWGSSNVYPLYGQEIDPETFEPIGQKVEIMHLQPEKHGWERFGEANDNTFLAPFTEGAWMSKHEGTYYFQYGAPGTEFSGYADGVYISKHPLGPFTYQSHNPFSYKPGGFARGAGHGATFQDLFGNWWHISTIGICVKNNFERRNGVWPTHFDEDGVMWTNTAFGDYPHFAPHEGANHAESQFTGWMLLNYQKPVRVSSTLGGYMPNFAVDEDIKTYWSAQTGESGEWIESDLGELCSVYAVQINYADQDADVMGKQPGLFHQYRLWKSEDGEHWQILLDKSVNAADVPHDYVELDKPVRTRFLKLENVHMPTGTFAISGLRVFGKGDGEKPCAVEEFDVLRGPSEPRNAWIKWKAVDEAIGYQLWIGTDPGKLYTSILVYGQTEYYYRAMTADEIYYFAIESFNENGVSERSEVKPSSLQNTP